MANHTEPLQQQSGLYYDQIGQVKIIRNHYDIITHIDLNKLKERADHYQILEKRLSNICKKTNCGPGLTTSEDLAEKINADFESLNDILGNRVKRSWYKTIQNTVKIIHGLINENEVRTYEYVIKQKVENNTRLLNEIQGKFGVLNSDLTKQNNKLQELEELVTKMNTDLNKLYQERTNYKLYTEEVKKLQIEQYLQAINSYGISIHADIQTIITAILFAKRNTIHPKEF